MSFVLDGINGDLAREDGIEEREDVKHGELVDTVSHEKSAITRRALDQIMIASNILGIRTG